MKTLANDLVGKLDPEHFDKKEPFVHEEDAVVQSLMNAYMYNRAAFALDTWVNAHKEYEKAVRRSTIAKVNPFTNVSQEQIQHFYEKMSIIPAKDFAIYNDVFLSQVCMKANQNDITINLNSPFQSFGVQAAFEDKKITLIGDVHSLGVAMKSGELILKGNTQNAGCLATNPAKITVEGNVDDVGRHLAGAVITITAPSANFIGMQATSGQIYMGGKLVYDEVRK